jgi:SMODS-associated and fused to various effectors sensor domain
MESKTLIIIAHYGIDKKITREQCEKVIIDTGYNTIEFIDFETGYAKLSELYDLPFDNIALAQQRKFMETVKPVLDKYPDAHIAYFGLTPIPVAFHFGYLIGNTHSYTIYQWHHQRQKWFAEIDLPAPGYVFELKPLSLPQEVQKGKGDVAIRVSTSFRIDPLSTYEVVENPSNEFDIELTNPHPDSLHKQINIATVVNAFQDVLNAYANKLSDREQIHLFMAVSAGLPFALGTRINPTIYPFVQTYQFSRDQLPKYREAILISKEVNDRVPLTDEDKKVADIVRGNWEKQLQEKIKPFIKTITGKKTDNWIETICESDEEYNTVSQYLKSPWIDVTDIGGTTLKDDKIDLAEKNVDDGFEYIEKTNTWILDDGFLSGLKRRLDKNSNTDLMQAGRLFFFHEALHYSKNGHSLTKEIANGIGQFPKVIEEADYQADAWALLTEYRYCKIHAPEKLKNGVKIFFCNAIETAVETMWSFMDTGTELSSIQIRAMNRFLNWYWQWIRIEDLDGQGKLEEIVCILFDKPTIEFAGAPMTLRAHRTYYKLSVKQSGILQLAAFIKNRVYRFAPNFIQEIVDGFRQMNGEKIKTGLKSFQTTIR